MEFVDPEIRKLFDKWYAENREGLAEFTNQGKALQAFNAGWQAHREETRYDHWGADG